MDYQQQINDSRFLFYYLLLVSMPPCIGWVVLLLVLCQSSRNVYELSCDVHVPFTGSVWRIYACKLYTIVRKFLIHFCKVWLVQELPGNSLFRGLGGSNCKQ